MNSMIASNFLFSYLVRFVQGVISDCRMMNLYA